MTEESETKPEAPPLPPPPVPISFEDARAKLRLWIPTLIKMVFRVYRRYLTDKRGGDWKLFKEFNQAGISANKHLQELLKIYQQVGDAGEVSPAMAAKILRYEQRCGIWGTVEDEEDGDDAW